MRFVIQFSNALFAGSRLTLVVLIAISLLSLVACSHPGQAGQLATPTFTAEQALGKRVFEQHCQSCHSTIPDSIVVGPSLAGVAQRAASRIEGMEGREYLEMSITQPGEYLVEGYKDLMPTALSDALSEEEVQAVLSYLMTLEE